MKIDRVQERGGRSKEDEEEFVPGGERTDIGGEDRLRTYDSDLAKPYNYSTQKFVSWRYNSELTSGPT
jgi:hypothetical protein